MPFQPEKVDADAHYDGVSSPIFQFSYISSTSKFVLAFRHVDHILEGFSY